MADIRHGLIERNAEQLELWLLANFIKETKVDAFSVSLVFLSKHKWSLEVLNGDLKHESCLV